jgi:hypothetical protein
MPDAGISLLRITDMLSTMFKSALLLASCLLLPASYAFSGLMTSFHHSRPLFAAPFGIDDTSDPRHQTIKLALSKLERVYEASSSFFEKLDTIVEVKTSLIEGAGMGLFAKKNIKSGSIISFYPVHAIGVDFGESSVCLASNDAGQKYFQGESESKNSNYQQYLLGSRLLAGACVTELFDGDALFVDVDPNQVDRAGWKGQYVNDGAVVEVAGENGIVQYYQRSRLRKNCVHVPFGPCPILAIVATRKVKKGEELFTTYGGSYWLDVLIPNAEIDVTDAIQQESLATAKDIYTSMQSIAVTYQNEADRLTI